ncbi:MAG TPA: SMC-Scp complex subunit ScpB, partial [Rhizobium sp.]|nr:SMC-Scp complex subunit ScpB [Rhizobium sp.]
MVEALQEERLDLGDDEEFTPERERAEREALRIAEALVFASAEPVSEKFLADRLPRGANVAALMRTLKVEYAGRGVNLVQIGDHWAFRTAADISFVIRKEES